MTSSRLQSSGARADESEEPAIERDELFKLLGNERRRHAVEFLQSRAEPVSLDTLATHVAARETDQPAEAVTASERKRVYTSLQQTHLPRMDEAGAVEFDKERGVITPAESLGAVTLHLDVVTPSGLPESVVYLGIGGCSLLVALVALVAPGLVAVLPPLGWAALVLAAFAGAAAVHRYLQFRGDDAA
ncbi:MAG: hypothetical protein ABEJ34_00585 [Haloferacaceae archaeon]